MCGFVIKLRFENCVPHNQGYTLKQFRYYFSTQSKLEYLNPPTCLRSFNEVGSLGVGWV